MLLREILRDVVRTSGYRCRVLQFFPVERIEQGNESSLSRPRPDAVTRSLTPSLDRSRRRRFMPVTPSSRSVNNTSSWIWCRSDPTLYRSLAGGLQYLTFTRPDLSYVVQQVCLYMHDPREPHFAALKRILRYVRGNVDFGLQLYASATTSLLNVSTPFLAPVPKLNTAWLHNLLRELHSHLSTATLVYCDNVSVVYMPGNPVQHQWTKHIEIDIQFVRDMVTASQVRVLHVPSRYQYADIFTKGLSSALFEEFRSSLSVHPPPAPTAGAY
ncbi:ribonuclease H-like domain-containing protein [Tanacetum coccineum]